MAEREPEPQRDAIIFVPGLSAAPHRRLPHITAVLCNELDRAATSERARFQVRPSSSQPADPAELYQTISRVDGARPMPVADVYFLDQDKLHQADQTPTSPLVRVFTLALTVLAGVLVWVPAAVRSFRRRRAKPLSQLLQLLLSLGILLLLGAYLVTAVVALVQLVLTAYAQATDNTRPEITWPQEVVVVVAVLGVLLPNARQRLADEAESYLRMIRYLWFSGPRDTLRGEVLTLLERVSERPEVGPIHLVGFSFGSLVAIDTVYPQSKPPTPRIGRLSTLVTLGCPFDLVRILLPHYFEQRLGPGDARPHWLNIYDPIDLLGSNFRDDGKVEPASRGVEIVGAIEPSCPDLNLPWNGNQRLGAVTGLMLASLRVHAQYWGKDPQADTALGCVATQLLGTRAQLSRDEA
jgi:hypothetical protein